MNLQTRSRASRTRQDGTSDRYAILLATCMRMTGVNRAKQPLDNRRRMGVVLPYRTTRVNITSRRLVSL